MKASEALLSPRSLHMAARDSSDNGWPIATAPISVSYINDRA